VSTAIKNSLNKLTSSLVKLEKAIDAKQSVLTAPAQAAKKTGKTPQDDLFSAMTAGQSNPSNINPQNVRMLATRLDNAINQVEAILKEGHG
jgi:hypothetical protein